MPNSGLVRGVRRHHIVEVIGCTVIIHLRYDNVFPLVATVGTDAAAEWAAVQVAVCCRSITVDVIVKGVLVVQKMHAFRGKPEEQTIFTDWRVALYSPGDVVLISIAAECWLQ